MSMQLKGRPARLLVNFLFVAFAMVGGLSLAGVPGNGFRLWVGVCAATAITVTLWLLERRASRL